MGREELAPIGKILLRLIQINWILNQLGSGYLARGYIIGSSHTRLKWQISHVIVKLTVLLESPIIRSIDVPAVRF